MKVEYFLGVPHAQVNAYLQKLNLYQIRAARGHAATVPEFPEFVLNPPTSKHDSVVESVDLEAAKNRVGDRSSRCTASSSYSGGLPQEEPRMRSGASQKASLYAMRFASCIMEDEIPYILKRTDIGDPASVKTYGWRLIHSEPVLNPQLAIPFTERKWTLEYNGKDAETNLIYMAFPSVNVDINTLITEVLKGSERVQWSRHLHKALIYSSWNCAHGHEAKSCMDADKYKRVLVCAALPDQSGKMLPLRVDTFVYKPEGIGEVRAYAEFARSCIVRFRNISDKSRLKH
jgi:hypothetical protein